MLTCRLCGNNGKVAEAYFVQGQEEGQSKRKRHPSWTRYGMQIDIVGIDNPFEEARSIMHISPIVSIGER